MASTEFQSKVKEFVKASAPGGKSDTITNKTLKRINEDCNLKSATGLTQTDLDIKFSGGLAKIKAKGGMTISQFEDFCKNYLAEQIAKSTKGDKDEIAKKIHDKICQGSVKSHGATKTVKTGGVERMTDSSKFTGSHKERFDAAGKGKGLEGRVNKVDDSGYVGNYKMQGTYDKKM